MTSHCSPMLNEFYVVKHNLGILIVITRLHSFHPIYTTINDVVINPILSISFKIEVLI
jgi:hypothetical protein